MESNNLDIALPKELGDLSKRELMQRIRKTNDVEACLDELSLLYSLIENDKCFVMPFGRNDIVEFILDDVYVKGKVLGYERSVRPDGTLLDAIMVGFYKDKQMTQFKELLAFPMQEMIDNIEGVPIEPCVLAFGGTLDKKEKEI